MEKTVIRVKGIIKKEDKYLVLKKWYDDHIPEPFMWEFVEGEMNFGERPDQAVIRNIYESLGVNGKTERILYAWSHIVGETQYFGVAYLCEVEGEEFILTEDFGGYEWISKEEIENYISSQHVLNDIADVEF